MAEPRIIALPDAEALAHAAADWLLAEALASAGRFAIALSGGSTPKRLYELLARSPLAEHFPWERVFLFWGDERLVPYDHPDSNARMVQEALIGHVPIPPAQVHRMPVAGTAADCAREYQDVLQVYYGHEALDMERPLFDVVLLGLGENGHTASLFPGTPAVDEALSWVAPVTEFVPQPRLTLTFPAIACSRNAAFLVTGSGKRDVLQRVLDGDRAEPAARVRSIGDLLFFIDEAAAP